MTVSIAGGVCSNTGVPLTLINASHTTTVPLYSARDGMVSVLTLPLLICETLGNRVDSDPFTSQLMTASSDSC